MGEVEVLHDDESPLHWLASFTVWKPYTVHTQHFGQTCWSLRRERTQSSSTHAPSLLCVCVCVCVCVCAQPGCKEGTHLLVQSWSNVLQVIVCYNQKWNNLRLLNLFQNKSIIWCVRQRTDGHHHHSNTATRIIRGLTHYFAEGGAWLPSSCPPMNTTQKRTNIPTERLAN